MEVYRQIVDVKNHTLNLLLPDKFKNGKFEVVVSPIRKRKKNKNRKPSDFMGCISKEAATLMLKQVEESRKEWERDI